MKNNQNIIDAIKYLDNKYHCLENNFIDTPTKKSYHNDITNKINYCLKQLKNAPKQLILEDINIIKQLEKIYYYDLKTLENSTKNLENISDQLTKTAFSNTAKLEGEIIFALAQVQGNHQVENREQSIPENLTLSHRTRLEFINSFNGSDELRIRFQSRNVPEFEDITGTSMANLGFDGNSDGNIELSRLDYETNLGEHSEIYFNIVGGGLGDYLDNINGDFSGSGDGAISLFARENPIRRQGGAPGIGLSHQLNDNILLQWGYVAPEADDLDVGIFQSPYGLALQGMVEFSNDFRFSLTYIRSFNAVNTGTSSSLAANPFNGDSRAIMADSWGAEISWDLSSQTTFGARVGYINAQAQDLERQPEAQLLTWAMLLALKDLGKEGNLLGFVWGQPLRVIGNNYGLVEDNGSWHLEVFYRLKINDHIAITPGFFMIINPENNLDNAPILVSTVRTTFTF
ncbi:iron uptake porin [Cyanobacterium stanieri LEGE 03274]|uniref:Iron uptake porin n=1 Tax=Cyanobacterium stanieri LEGE 03274 TaxID=1828756 RepID=A0ABR9UZP5_9CHRO|nr:iron uptake porin [Cyanobacterium stanieri]MBE9221090.1 iron uptake porin [Cyanobacterium stanieri LEGE 03274]